MDKPPRKYALARQFRQELTPPEARLWARLKLKPEGVKFRRQHPVGPYIFDFYCPAAGLAIEVDGQAHNLLTVAQRDERRESWLRGEGFEIMRITADEIMVDPDEVVLGILAFVSESLRAKK